MGYTEKINSIDVDDKMSATQINTINSQLQDRIKYLKENSPVIEIVETIEADIQELNNNVTSYENRTINLTNTGSTRNNVNFVIETAAELGKGGTPGQLFSSISYDISTSQQMYLIGCETSCSALCTSSCTGTCGDSCTSCSGNCTGCSAGCTEVCTGCSKGCTNNCSGTCAGCTSCTGGCVSCSGACSGSCSGCSSCSGTCTNTCNGCSSCSGSCSGCSSTCKSGCTSCSNNAY